MYEAVLEIWLSSYPDVTTSQVPTSVVIYLYSYT